MSEHVSSHDAHDGHEHSAEYGKYMAVAVALVILTAMSYWTFTPLWPFGDNIAIKRMWMMAVSCSKAMLVIMFFMHLLWEANWKWVLTIPATCMSVFLALALVPDIGMRQNNGYGGYSRERMLHAAVPQDEHATSKDAHQEDQAHKQNKHKPEDDHSPQAEQVH